MLYRAEIDGLRSIAVVPVILFHSGIGVFSGGFLGVDVFFVISGYLITAILIDELDEGRFSLLQFYERRARRILPALFFVLLCTLPFAWYWLTPRAIDDYFQSIWATIFFVSNILFMFEAGYFDASSEDKPLLHTWSLAVEEQYYIFFPLFLMALWRLGRGRAFWAIALVAFVSLIFCEYVSRFFPSASFYLAPTRAWQLLAGSLSALWIRDHGVKSNSLVSFLGLVVILTSIFLFDENTRLPGLYSLAPVVGTIAIIVFGGGGSITSKLLSMKIFVGVGLISYSAYLWHQPLIVFWRWSEFQLYYNPFVASIVTLGLAYFSWRYIESPMRKKGKSRSLFLARKAPVLACSILMVSAVASAYSTSRYDEKDLRVLQEFDGRGEFVSAKFSQLKLKSFDSRKSIKVLVIGDSYAQDLVNALLESSQGYAMSLSSVYIPARCGNLFVEQDLQAYRSPSDSYKCAKSPYLDASVVDLITKADYVLLSSQWSNWTIDLLPESVRNLNAVYGRKFIVFNTKSFGAVSEREYAIGGVEYLLRAHTLNDIAAVNSKLLGERQQEVEAGFIDSQTLLCESYNSCRNSTPDGLPISYDGRHLTPAGAQMFGSKLEPFINEWIAEKNPEG